MAAEAENQPLQQPQPALDDDEECATRPTSGQHILAAINYNSKRQRGAPFDEASDGKLGSVYTMVTELLLARGDWGRRSALRNKADGVLKLPSSYHLLLGTAQGKGLQWGRLGYGMWPPPLVNYCRGFDILTRKGRLIATLANAQAAWENSWPAAMPDYLKTAEASRGGVWELAPQAFVFHPSKGEANPYNELQNAFHASSAASSGSQVENAWILKPSDGSKGDRIRIMVELEEINRFLQHEAEKHALGDPVSSWVVQKYIHNPLLLEDGRRKFDMRCWVLLDPDYNIKLYRHGVLRTSAVEYNPNDLSNRFSHLTNHCIAAEHENYGHYEPTNELFYAAFDDELIRRFPEIAEKVGSVLQRVVLPQVRRTVVQTLLAGRETLENNGDYYRSFQLFGYDFLVDEDLRVWLCEINASPAVAEALLPGLCSALVRECIDPVCPPNQETMSSLEEYHAAGLQAKETGDAFEMLYENATQKDES
ncbi:hypothetical protein AB1Y20_007483 [Prymnesium parvum]|uniref:Tubulin--tyrosine ligase n=1 Tax=Prymnesium parvum TaxID=97485 RepID=A0AB34IXL3_PRYPA